MADCLAIVTYCLELEVNWPQLYNFTPYVALALPRYQSHKESFRALLKRPDVNIDRVREQTRGFPLLHWAAGFGAPEAMEDLRRWRPNECPMDELTDCGMSLLQVAARYDYSGLSVRYLLNTVPDRVDVNWEKSAESGGGTALHAAVASGNFEAVRAFRELCANDVVLSIRDAAGKTPAYIAIEMVGKEVAIEKYYRGGEPKLIVERRRDDRTLRLIDRIEVETWRGKGFLCDRTGEFDSRILTELFEIQKSAAQ